MKNKILIIIIGILILGLFLYGLHFRIVTKAEIAGPNRYDYCDTIELHNLRIEKNTSDENNRIVCFDDFSIWWAI